MSYPSRMCECDRAIQTEPSTHWEVPEAEVLKHVNMEALPVHYTAQWNARMNTDAFELWFYQDFTPSVK